MTHDVPATRFVTDAQGRRIAYSVHGHGPPLVFSAWWVSNIEQDWSQPGYREFFGQLAEHFTVVRYDRLGSGLSDRERTRVELSDEVQTLRCVIEALAFDTVSIFALSCAGPPSLRFAVESPERVSKLIFFGSYIDGSDVGTPEVQQAVEGLVRASWGLGSKTLTDLFAPGIDADGREALSRAQRDAASSEMASQLLCLTYQANVRALAEKVRAPTLVVHRRQDRAIPFSAGRELAVSIPDAAFRAIEGDAHLPWIGNADEVLQLTLDFLGAPGTLVTSFGETRTLTREGELWKWCFDGEEVYVPDARGICDLAILLASPDQEVHASTLWSGAQTAAALPQVSDPMLDEQALDSYRLRLGELEHELAEADGMADLGRAQKLREERDAIADELRGAVGLGGRRRVLTDVSERARKAVSARIRASLKKISAVHPVLGQHLQDRVTTGVFCCYRGDGDSGWAVR